MTRVNWMGWLLAGPLLLQIAGAGSAAPAASADAWGDAVARAHLAT